MQVIAMKLLQPCVRAVAFSNQYMKGKNNLLLSLPSSHGRSSYWPCSLSSSPRESPVALFSTAENELETSFISAANATIDSSNGNQQEYASSYHAPVMWKECIDALLKRSHNTKKRKKNKYKMEEHEDGKDDLTYDLTLEDRPKVFIDGRGSLSFTNFLNILYQMANIQPPFLKFYFF